MNGKKNTTKIKKKNNHNLVNIIKDLLFLSVRYELVQIDECLVYNRKLGKHIAIFIYCII